MSIASYVLAALGALWIDYGWRPLDGGGHEYIIQVPPELIDSLRSEGVESYVPPDVHDIRRIRITVGNERLPQTTATAAQSPAADASVQQAADSPGTNDAQQRIAKYPDAVNDSTESKGSESQESAAAAVLERLGLDAFTATAIGLGVACALLVFLACVHASMRTRYRALLQKHELRRAL